MDRRKYSKARILGILFIVRRFDSFKIYFISIMFYSNVTKAKLALLHATEEFGEEEV